MTALAMWGEVEKIALLEHRPALGGPHLIGLRVKRACGCFAVAGMRLDLHEMTFGAVPCELHYDECARALEVSKAMPPSDEDMMALWPKLLDAEIMR